MSAETISNDEFGREAGWSAGPGGRGRRGISTTRATALSTAVALVLVGGVVTAAYRTASSGTSAAELAPSSTFAFAQVDLDLPGGQDHALSTLLNRFPSSPTHHSTGSVQDTVLGAMFRDSSDPHVDYAKDVKPWLGDRAAVAGWLDSAGKPQVEFLLRSTDDTKARASLHRLAPTAGLEFRKGYVVIGMTPALAAQAVAASTHSSLAGNSTYRHDIATLSGPQVALGWADLRSAVKAIRSALSASAPFALIPGGAFIEKQLDKVTGRFVFGAEVTDTYAQLVVRGLGTMPSSAGTAPSTLLNQLPDGTLAAVEISHPGAVVTQITTALRALLPSSTRTSTVHATTAVCPAGVQCQTSIGGTVLSPTPPVVRDIDPLQKILEATGLSLPQDATTLLGSGAVISYGGLRPQGLPNVAIRSEPANLAAAKAVAAHSSAVIASHVGLQLAVSSAGNDLVVATNPSYADAIATGGHLGTQSRFAQAMGQLPDHIGFAAYVDLGDILPLFSHGDPNAAHFKAAGFWVGDDSHGELVQLRLVVG